MADYMLAVPVWVDGNPTFPNGTIVNATPLDGSVDDGVKATVSGGSLAFTGLLPYKTYVARAVVAGEMREARFSSPADTASSATFTGQIDVTTAPYNATGDGATDDSAAFTACAAAAVAGGKTMYVPVPAVAYKIANVRLPANLTLRHADGVVYKSALAATASPAIFLLGSSLATTASFVENIWVGGGRATIDMSDLVDDVGQPSGIVVTNVRNCYVENITGKGLPQPAGNVLNLIRNQAGAQPGAGSVYAPTGSVFRGIRNTDVRGNGSSCAQVSSAIDCRFEDFWADGACAGRIESHVSSVSHLNGLVENCVFDGMSVDPTSTQGSKTTGDAIALPPDDTGHWAGSAATYLLPHDSCVVRNITMRNIRASGGSSGCYVSKSSAPATLDNCSIERLFVSGGGKGIKVPNGTSMLPTRMVYRDCHVEGAIAQTFIATSGNGHDYCGGNWYSCTAKNCAQEGFKPAYEPTTVTPGKIARLTNCQSRGNKYGITIDHHEKVLIVGGDFGDDSSLFGAASGATSKLATSNDRDVNTTVGSWVTGSGTKVTVTRTTTSPIEGAGSLKMVPAGAYDPAVGGYVAQPTGTSGIAVSPGDILWGTGTYQLQSGAASIDVQTTIWWWKSDGSASSVKSETRLGTATVAPAGAAVTSSGSAAAPSDAAYCTLVVYIPGATVGDVLLGDTFDLKTGVGVPVQQYALNVAGGNTTPVTLVAVETGSNTSGSVRGTSTYVTNLGVIDTSAFATTAAMTTADNLRPTFAQLTRSLPVLGLPDVVGTIDPRACSGTQAVSAVNAFRGGQVTIPRDGTLTEMMVFPVVSSGNISIAVYDLGEGSAGNRTRLATTGAVACPAAISSSQAGVPVALTSSLAVTKGQRLEFVVTADNTTVTFLRAATGGNVILPATWAVNAGAISNKLGVSGSSNHPAGSSVSEATFGSTTVVPCVLAKLV